MFMSYSKNTLLILAMLMMVVAYIVSFNWHNQTTVQQAITSPATNKSILADNKQNQRHSPSLSTSSATAVLSKPLPQDWLAAFQRFYLSSNFKAVKLMLLGINTERRAEFIEQLLLQVQFLPTDDLIRAELEIQLITRLSSLAPPRAADHVLSVLQRLKKQPEQPFLLRQLVGGLIQTWSKQNLPQALAWAVALNDEQTKTEALNLLSYTKDEQQIDLIAREIASLPAGNLRSLLFTHLAEQKARIDPEAAVAWVASWPDSPARNSAISALINARKTQSIEDAATLVDQALAAGMMPDESATDMLVTQWQTQSPNEAYSWASNLPDSSVKRRALTLLNAMREIAHE
jgi:hypothetical protein